MLLTEEGIESLMVRIAAALAESAEAHAILLLNHRPASPDLIRTALAGCAVTMTRGDIHLRADAVGRTFLYPLGGMIADAINAELGIVCGFVMQ